MVDTPPDRDDDAGPARRTPLWDRESQQRYQAASERAHRAAVDRHAGEHTAAALAEIWPGLGADARAFMEYLLLSDSRTVIARYEDTLFTELLAKELLQLPPGVGTVLMQRMETAYRVPTAVWRRLADDRARYCGAAGDADARRGELETRFGARVQALLGDPPGAGGAA